MDLDFLWSSLQAAQLQASDATNKQAAAEAECGNCVPISVMLSLLCFLSVPLSCVGSVHLRGQISVLTDEVQNTKRALEKLTSAHALQVLSQFSSN